MIFNLFGTKVAFKFDFNHIKWFKFWNRFKHEHGTYRQFSSELNLYHAYIEYSDCDFKGHEYDHYVWQFSLLNLGNDYPYWALIGTGGEYDNYKNSEEWHADFSIELLFFLRVNIEWWREPKEHITLDDVIPSYEEKL